MENTSSRGVEISVRRIVTFALIAAIYLALPNVYPRFNSPNEMSRLRLTRALVEHRSFRIDPYLRNPSPRTVSDVSFYRGHFYSDKAAGMSFAAVPALGVLRLVVPDASTVTMLVTARVVTVLLPSLIALWCLLGWCRSPFRYLAVVGLFLGSVITAQVLNFTGHVPATIAICGAAALVGIGEPRAARAAIAGALAGAAILIDFTLAVAAAALVPVVAVRTRSFAKTALFASCCAVIAVVQLLVNAYCFDGPFDFAYNHMFNPADQVNRGTGFFGIATPKLNAVWGLTFGGMKGMFVHSPFLLLALPGIAAAVRRRRDALEVWAVAMCIAYFWFNASLRDWEGGWSLGPRYLTPIYPLLVFLMIRWLEQDRPQRRQRVVYAVLVATIAWSVLLHVTGMLTWPRPPVSTLLTFPALELPAFLAFRGAFAPNLFALIGLPVLLAVSIVVLLALAAIVVNTGLRSLPYVLIASMVFVIALARAVPEPQSEVARRFEVFLYYMGHEP